MTISSTTRTAGPFIGNGTALIFPFAFKVFQASDLLVVKLQASNGALQELALTTDYTVLLNLDQDSNPGGSITLTAGALPSGYSLSITSDVPNTQLTDLTNQGGFYPDVINDSLDRATIQIQQINSTLDRTLKFPLSDTGINSTLPVASQRLGKTLAFSSLDGSPIVGPSIGDTQTLSANMAAIVTVANDLNEPVSEIDLVANNIAAVNSAAANAALAQDAVTFLMTYINQVIMNVQFPLDLGLVADPVITNAFDLGAV